MTEGECPRCHSNNECAMAESGSTKLTKCWCFDADFSALLHEKLKQDYPKERCLCNACIEELEREIRAVQARQ